MWGFRTALKLLTVGRHCTYMLNNLIRWIDWMYSWMKFQMFQCIPHFSILSNSCPRGRQTWCKETRHVFLLWHNVLYGNQLAVASSVVSYFGRLSGLLRMSFFGSAVAQAMNRALKCPVSTGQSGKESLVNCWQLSADVIKEMRTRYSYVYSFYILFTKAGVSADARTDKLRCLFSIFFFFLSFLSVACFSTVAAFGPAVRSVWTQCLDVLGSFKKLNACRVRGFFVASQSIAFSDITTSNMCCIKWLCRPGLRSSSVKLTSRNSVLVMSCTSFVQALCKVAWPKDASCQLNLQCL